MIGQARPADARRDAHARELRRPVSPGSGRMQPPTEPAPAATHGRTPRGDEDELYRRHHRDLAARRRPRRQRAARADRGRLPDRLDDHAPRPARPRPRSSAGCYVVATREAYRLCERERRDAHLETMLAHTESWDAVIADAFSIDDILEAREALAILAEPPRTPARRPHPPGRRLQLPRDRRDHRRAHVHQRQQAPRQGPRPRPTRAAQRHRPRAPAPRKGAKNRRAALHE